MKRRYCGQLNNPSFQGPSGVRPGSADECERFDWRIDFWISSCSHKGGTIIGNRNEKVNPDYLDRICKKPSFSLEWKIWYTEYRGQYQTNKKTINKQISRMPPSWSLTGNLKTYLISRISIGICHSAESKFFSTFLGGHGPLIFWSIVTSRSGIHGPPEPGSFTIFEMIGLINQEWFWMNQKLNQSKLIQNIKSKTTA